MEPANLLLEEGDHFVLGVLVDQLLQVGLHTDHLYLHLSSRRIEVISNSSLVIMISIMHFKPRVKLLYKGKGKCRPGFSEL